MRCTHDLWKHLLHQLECRRVFVAPRQWTHTHIHMLLGTPNAVAMGKIKKHLITCCMSKWDIVRANSFDVQKRLMSIMATAAMPKRSQQTNKQKYLLPKYLKWPWRPHVPRLQNHKQIDFKKTGEAGLSDVSVSLKLMSQDAPSSQIRKDFQLRGSVWLCGKSPWRKAKQTNKS